MKGQLTAFMAGMLAITSATLPASATGSNRWHLDKKGTNFNQLTAVKHVNDKDKVVKILQVGDHLCLDNPDKHFRVPPSPPR